MMAARLFTVVALETLWFLRWSLGALMAAYAEPCLLAVPSNAPLRNSCAQLNS
jgi:hypothetical protein